MHCIKVVLLWDDIYTTGATLEAAASLLKEAGATCVEGLALGWSLKDGHLDHLSEKEKKQIQEERLKIHDDFETYCKVARRVYKTDSKNTDKRLRAVARLVELQVGDYIWMRNKGVYYLGRVLEGSQYRYKAEVKEWKLDASNQRDKIQWKCIGKENGVAGAIITAFFRGRTIQHINKVGILEYSQLKFGDEILINSVGLPSIKEVFFNYMSPSECEDLVALYLYDKHQFICIPSTNKINTEKYEFVLINSKGQLAYPQVKTGDIEIKVSDYSDLVKDKPTEFVYLFSSTDKFAEENNQYDNVICISSDTLFDWLKNQVKYENKIIPSNIKDWYDLANRLSSK